jgi:acetaldehyde dehydrogenase (acetylating)
MNDDEKDKLRRLLFKTGKFNTDTVGQSPSRIASMAGFNVPNDTRALVGEVEKVGKAEPLSMETLSPILSFYTVDGWQAGCDRCIEILHFGGIGHTLSLHCTSEPVIEAFALQKPSMRIVVNTVAALGSVGYTNRLFPAMTLGPGTIGGSITSDNISPMHLLNVKRLAFETNPVNVRGKGEGGRGKRVAASSLRPVATAGPSKSWMDEIEARLLARAGNPSTASAAPSSPRRTSAPAAVTAPIKEVAASTLPLADAQIEQLIQRFKK